MFKIVKYLFVIAAALAAHSLWRHLSRPAVPTSEDTSQSRVYVSQSGNKFHRKDCRFTDAGMRSISLAEALKAYTPCAICKPLAKE